MIQYSPGYWSVLFSLSWEGSVLPKSAVWAIPCAVITYVTHNFFHEHFEDWDTKDTGMNLMAPFLSVLGFLIVFRVTLAYSRWWEGGTLLLKVRGEWFNAFSSLIALSNPDPEKAMEVVKFQHTLVRLMSLLYGTAVLQVCTIPDPDIDILDIGNFDMAHINHLAKCHDKVEIVLQWIQKSVVSADASQIIKAAPPILTRVYNQLGNGMAILVESRKIGEFPIPFPVAQMITFMLFFQWICIVLVATMCVKESWWAATLAFLTTICLWSINYMAVELEMPFGDDLNDLPLNHLQADMNASLVGLLHPKALSPPTFDLNITEEGEAKLDTQSLGMQDGIMLFRRSEQQVSIDDGNTPSTPAGVDKRPGLFERLRARRSSSNVSNNVNDPGERFHVQRSFAARRDHRYMRRPHVEDVKRTMHDIVKPIEKLPTFVLEKLRKSDHDHEAQASGARSSEPRKGFSGEDIHATKAPASRPGVNEESLNGVVSDDIVRELVRLREQGSSIHAELRKISLKCTETKHMPLNL